MTVTIVVSPSSPIAGGPVTFTITASDPDSTYMGRPGLDDGCSGDFGDGNRPVIPDTCGGITKVLCPPAPHGPWTPPARHSVQKTYTVTHTYGKAGTYQARFTLQSIGDPSYCGNDPYANYRESDLTVNVSSAPTSAPT
jgi:hypothetical protein